MKIKSLHIANFRGPHNIDIDELDNPQTNLTVIAHYKVNRAVASIPLKIRKYKSAALPIETYLNALDGNTLFRDFFMVQGAGI